MGEIKVINIFHSSKYSNKSISITNVKKITNFFKKEGVWA